MRWNRSVQSGNLASQLVIDSIYPFFQKSSETDPLKKIEDAALIVNELLLLQLKREMNIRYGHNGRNFCY
jgi:hypothetical protein